MVRKKLTGKCSVCGKRAFSDHSIYCRRCWLFVRRMNQRGVHPDAVKAILNHVRKHGFVCQYTWEPVNLEDPQDPFYYSFDHRIPGDDRTVVLTFALLNEMKSDMTFDEFEYYLHQIDRCLRTGARIRRRRLVFWQRLVRLALSRRKSRNKNLPAPIIVKKGKV